MGVRTDLLRILVLSLLVWSSSSCAALTESQLQTVQKLAVSGDSVAVAPSVLFRELAAIRTERGLFYVASLTGADARFRELNALAAAAREDEKLAERTDVCVDVLNSYLRALRSISNPTRWKQIGTEMRGLGNNLDSMILRFNQLEWVDLELPQGVAKLTGKYAGYLSENYMKNRQAVAVYEFVTEGDTLVSVCVDALVQLLRKQEVQELIDNELTGLQNNYLAYLHRIEVLGQLPSVDHDRRYITLLENLEKAKSIRNKCVNGLQSLKRAHHKLLTQLDKWERWDYWHEELMELNTLAVQLSTLIKELK
ncbi:MAG TPA: hypothetical protein PK676_07765 [Bacteroidales bacterium]|nr:hypothetical protein [Bacteroidales bacterium]